MALRFSKVDALILPDHYYLNDNDECYFLGEYTARKGFNYSETNQLIYNFKKSPEVKGTPQWRYKQKAMTEAGIALRQVLAHESNLQWLKSTTLIPVPPSKAKTDPLYDDRMLRVLQVLGNNLALDIRELVLQHDSTSAAHESDDRPTPDELIVNYYVDEEVCDPEPTNIAVFDDLLTTGCHFRAIKSVLQARFPAVRIVGIFIARRVPESEDESIVWPTE